MVNGQNPNFFARLWKALRLWRILLLLSAGLIWGTRPLWIDSGHHFATGLIFIIAVTFLLAGIVLASIADLIVVFLSMRSMPVFDSMSRIIWSILIISPTLVHICVRALSSTH